MKCPGTVRRTWLWTCNKLVKFFFKILSGCQENSKKTLGDTLLAHTVFCSGCHRLIFIDWLWAMFAIEPTREPTHLWAQRTVSETAGNSHNQSWSAISQNKALCCWFVRDFQRFWSILQSIVTLVLLLLLVFTLRTELTNFWSCKERICRCADLRMSRRVYPTL